MVWNSRGPFNGPPSPLPPVSCRTAKYLQEPEEPCFRRRHDFNLASVALQSAIVSPEVVRRIGASGAVATISPESGMLPALRHFSLVYTPTSLAGAPVRRWRTASKRNTAAATETFRLSTGE